jgi:hypothetical protein
MNKVMTKDKRFLIRLTERRCDRGCAFNSLWICVHGPNKKVGHETNYVKSVTQGREGMISDRIKSKNNE